MNCMINLRISFSQVLQRIHAFNSVIGKLNKTI